jgi:NAD-dependent protein deacetylase/lipoamidase sirtuin 4
VQRLEGAALDPSTGADRGHNSPGEAGAARPAASFEALVELLRGRRFVALTGAGCSTESGIPDYRGQGVPRRPRTPIQGPEFRRSPSLRRRYWARALEGWGRFQAAPPNAGHLALARLEASGKLAGIVTQNVDRLHHAAGSRRVVELHGALADVVCLACGALEARSSVQARLLNLNPGWGESSAEMAPDGDADLSAERLESFRQADCLTCEGALMPRVVFFGDNVPKPVVEGAFALVDEAEVLVVAGSSLAVFSGYRFLLHARKRGIPVAIVNIGPVRGEDQAAVKVEGPTGELLPRLYEALEGG